MRTTSLSFVFIVILLVFHLGNGASRSAEPGYEIINLNVKDGLSFNEVNCVFKDHKGFMWVGTNNGLNRYDAYEFKVWKHTPLKHGSISDNRITCIIEDADKNIWVGTENGINKYIPSDDNFLNNYTANTEGNYVHALYIDKKSTLYMGTRDGFYRFSENENKFKRIIIAPLSKRIAIQCIAQLPGQDKLWLGSFSEGVFEYDINEHSIKPINIGVSEIGQVNDILFDENKNALISTGKKALLTYNLTNGKVNQILEGTCYKTALGINNNYWVSINYTLYELNEDFLVKNTFSHDKKQKNSISFGRIKDIYRDSLTNIWLATGTSGIDIIKKSKKILKYFNPDTTKINYIKSFYIDKQENTWIGTFENGIWIYNNLRQNATHFSGFKNYQIRHITVIKEDIDSNIWVGTQNGLYKIDPITFQSINHYTIKDGLFHNNIIDVLDDRKGNMWIATQEGLNKLDKRSKKIVGVTQKDGLIYYKPNVLAKDKLDNIWIGTPKGVSIYDPSKKSYLNYGKITKNEAGLSDVYITSFCVDTLQNMWVGTSNGLNKYNYKKRMFTHYFETDGLVYNIIHNLHLDRLGNIWAHSPIGISKISPSNFNVNSIEILNNPDFSNNSFLDERDNLYVGNKKSGFYVLPLDSLVKHNKGAPVHITGIGINASQYTPPPNSKKLTIPFKNNSFKIKFTALTYDFGEPYRFAYQLSGYDKNPVFTTSTNREAIYSNLNPGEYVFRVFGAEDNSIQDNHNDTLVITILPPWWRTTIAMFSFILVTLLLAFIIIYLRNRRSFLINSIKQARLEFEASELKLRYFTDISHEIRTPLSLISLPIEDVLSSNRLEQEDRKRLNLANKNIVRLQNLINQLLDYRKVTKGKLTLTPKRIEIVGFIQSVLDVFGPNFEKQDITYTYLSNKEEYLVYLDVNLLDKIVFNLVSNAFKNTPVNGKIELHVNIEEDPGKVKSEERKKVLKLSVINTGKGIPKVHINKVFEPFYQVSDSAQINPAGYGIGLSLVKEYIALLKGEIWAESNPGNTTSFHLSIPLEEPSSISMATKDVTSKTSFKKEALSIMEEISLPEIEEEDATLANKKLILIVEDNKELRKMIISLLPNSYKTVEAENGKIGLEKALEIIPDIIISDIMMPEMNGYELCQRCKEHELTSHIPILLLTAKADTLSRVTGIETGADAYMSKPFEKRELISQMENLIKNREILQKKYQEKLLQNKENQDSSFPKHENTDQNYLNFSIPKNDRFINQIKDIVSQNYHKETFNTESLAKRALITRQHLHRKFSALTGISPSDFIKEFRLNKAHELIHSNKLLTVSEVVYLCGFKSISHFSRSYKEKFGKNPSE